jgi:hypothetical protein
MDSQTWTETPETQAIRDEILKGVAELVRQLPPLMAPFSKPLLAVVVPQVQSVSPQNLQSFLVEAAVKVLTMLNRGDLVEQLTGEPIPGVLAGGLELPALPAHGDDPFPHLESGHWFDPVSRATVVRVPTVADARAVQARIGELLATPDEEVTTELVAEIQDLAAAAETIALELSANPERVPDLPIEPSAPEPAGPELVLPAALVPVRASVA